jgi:hypothetical protein
MQLAYQREATRIWILNVGDLKANELPINHFLDLAYDTPLWGYNSTSTWLQLWATREFGADQASQIVSVVDQYGMLAARRKYELLNPTVYSVTNYNEADAVLAQWQLLATQAQQIYNELDAKTQIPFYELVLQPILGGQVVNQIHVGVGKNLHFTEQKRNTANTVAHLVLDAFQTDASLTQRYHDLLNGRWNHMLDQTHLGYGDYWQQPMRNAIPQLGFVQASETSLAGNLGVGIEASNATVSGDDEWHPNSGDTLVLPPIDPYGPATRWIDIFARGTGACDWTITPAVDYVIATPSSGTTGGNNGSDTKVYISVDWNKAPAAPNTTTVNIDIASGCGAAWGNYPPPTVQVPVVSTTIPEGFQGFVESDGHLAFEAQHTSAQTAVNGVSYFTIPNYGRTLSGVTLQPVTAANQPIGQGPVLEYEVYTFTNASQASVTLFISPSLNQHGPANPLTYAIAFDDQEPQEVQFVRPDVGGYLPNSWNGAVSDAVWGLSSGNQTTTTHDLSVTGAHTLKIWSITPGVVFQKVVIDVGGLRPSYLGPPESFLAGVDKVGTYDGTNVLGVQIDSALHLGTSLI